MNNNDLRLLCERRIPSITIDERIRFARAIVYEVLEGALHCIAENSQSCHCKGNDSGHDCHWQDRLSLRKLQTDLCAPEKEKKE